MIRNLKRLGLALIAVFAFAAVSASAASAANGTITSDGPFTLFGTEEGTNNRMTAFEGEITCSGTTPGTGIGEAEGGGSLASGATTVEVASTAVGPCLAAGTFPMTIHTNGCKYLLHLGETVAGQTDQYGGSADLRCPPSAAVEATLYLNEEAHEQEEPFCTITVEEQIGLEGGTITDETNGHLTLSGALEGITMTRSGVLCPEEVDNNATLEGAVTIVGTDAGGNETAVAISHE